MAKKRKQQAEEEAAPAPEQQDPQPSGRQYTVSLAVPGSVIDNTQNMEFAVFVAGQVGAPAAAVAAPPCLQLAGWPGLLPCQQQDAWAALTRLCMALDPAARGTPPTILLLLACLPGFTDSSHRRHIQRGRGGGH
jgi:hypothetical protein